MMANVIETIDNNYRVYVDDKPVEDVVRVDEFSGEVEILEKDFRTGEYVASPDGSPSRITLKGNVKKVSTISDADHENILETISRVYREQQEAKLRGEVPYSCLSERLQRAQHLWDKVDLDRVPALDALRYLYMLVAITPMTYGSNS